MHCLSWIAGPYWMLMPSHVSKHFCRALLSARAHAQGSMLVVQVCMLVCTTCGAGSQSRHYIAATSQLGLSRIS